MGGSDWHWHCPDPRRPSIYHSMRGYAWHAPMLKIAPRVEDDYGDIIALIGAPRDASIDDSRDMLESSYGSRGFGIQALINVELTHSMMGRSNSYHCPPWP